MATEVVHVIDPDMGSGYDYDSLFDWEAAEQGDLTGVRDEIAIAKCRCTGGTVDSTAVTIDGWTTSATQYIKIWTDPTETYRHSGKYETGNKYRFSTAGNSNGRFILADNYIVVDGLQFVPTSDQDYFLTSVSANGGYTIKNCVFHSTAATRTALPHLYIDTNHAVANSYIVNNVFDNAGLGIYSRPGSSSARVMIYNNTIYNCATGIRSRGAYNVVKNNLVIGCTDCYLESTEFEVADYNAYDEGTDPGTNGIDLSAYTDAQIFVDVATYDFHLATGSPAIGVGANLYADAYYAFQTDIDGDDRGGSGASWDIGAYEYISSAVSLVVADCGHDHASEAAALTQANILAIAEATHAHSADGIGYFIVTELRLVGTLTGQSGPVTETDVQVAVFAGTNIYDAVPVLQSSAVSISAGQIAIRHVLFGYEQLDDDYLIVFYKPGATRQGGGPHPATVADANA